MLIDKSRIEIYHFAEDGDRIVKRTLAEIADDEMNQQLTELRNVLAELYPLMDDIPRIIADAGFQIQKVTFEKRTLDYWNNILKFAADQNGVPDLMGVVRRDYPENMDLIEAYISYLESASRAVPQPAPAALIDELTCTIELLDTEIAKHTYSYKLSNFGGEQEEKTFEFFAKDTTKEELDLERWLVNGDPEANVDQENAPKGVRLIFPFKGEELKRIEFCYTAPAHAFLHKKTGVFSYRAELQHRMNTKLARLTIKLPDGSHDVRYEGKAWLSTAEDKVVFTETNIEKGFPVGFPVFFCNTNFIER